VLAKGRLFGFWLLSSPEYLREREEMEVESWVWFKWGVASDKCID